MESYGLYEDLSLFSGDLLVGMSPLADELPTPGQDGGFQEMFHPSVDLFADEPIKPSVPEQKTPTDDWMDKKLDLINLLSQPNVQITIQEATPSFDATEALQAPPEVVTAPSLPIPTDATNFATLQPLELPVVDRESLLLNMTDLLSTDFDESVVQPSVVDVSFGCLGDEAGDFSTDGLASLLSEEDLHALSSPTLSPVDPQDVEMILSPPSSPESMASVNDAVVPQIVTIDDSYLVSEDVQGTCAQLPNYAGENSSHGPVRAVRSARRKKYQPFSDCYDVDDVALTKVAPRSSKVTDRKERKKQQNKDAALRYRQKKKEEMGSVFDECHVLETKNVELKDKVDGMTREIQYLKDLLLEVYKAKGIQPQGLLLNGK